MQLIRTTTALAVPALLTAAVLAATSAGTASAGPTTGEGFDGYEPAGDTIVRVTGDAENGFGIHHYDGSTLFPPTMSESIAECGEYDTLRARVRCRTETRTWFRDLADTKQAIAWARYDAGQG